MLHIRAIKTKGKSRSVQVFYYKNSKRIILKHISLGSTDEEIVSLQEMARAFIADYTKQSYLFEDTAPGEKAVLISQCDYIGFYHTFLYDILRSVQHKIGYMLLADILLKV
ncbi:MAG: hypothetical protein A3H98_04820 [Bacteroidetes bacterium RIFCSPLOWO2_02_FULL_36_8]|nr:MAG: hypothetical protein A3H98_04820 [Bacteroidetes bacterium RIFCSPLOWO2_02_FULL_36_8]OFY70698.1 MAG: hypothetical protein A3G23_08245 [Bacteroidetes bacterium RIFCSPLOWO2_12_FULL_37_12]